MAIIINSVKEANIKIDFQWVHITVNADGDDCKFIYIAPKELENDDLQTYVDNKEDFYKREILRNMYLGADCYDEPLVIYGTDEEISGGWLKWIADGCKNAEVKGEDHEGNEYVITPETVIEKTAWVDLH